MWSGDNYENYSTTNVSLYEILVYVICFGIGVLILAFLIRWIAKSVGIKHKATMSLLDEASDASNIIPLIITLHILAIKYLIIPGSIIYLIITNPVLGLGLLAFGTVFYFLVYRR